ncbi:hypothetical protein [Microbacterium sp. KHB019]|uniref:hypothetical protein n=1 Tax=Microbacterium sp. KHB019 TaxID=3129770 RepID=UPI00307ADB40
MTGHVFVIQGDIRRFACDAYLHATDRDLRKGGGWENSAPDAVNRLDVGHVPDFKAERRYTLPLLDRSGLENEPKARERPDALALSSNGQLVVIELKRGSEAY